MNAEDVIEGWPCPVCGVGQGVNCRTVSGEVTDYQHEARWRLALKATKEARRGL